MISYTFVDGFTRSPRPHAIERMKQAIASADGVIVDFAYFGGEAIRLTVELDAGALATLATELETHDIELFTSCRTELTKAGSTMTSSHPIVAMLHITFLPREIDQPLSATL